MKKYVIEENFEYKGYKCVVVLQHWGGRCGYVGMPVGHPLYNISYTEMNIECHGGLTYGSQYMVGYGKTDNIYWIGFDCLHYGDGYDDKAVIEKICENEKDIARYESLTEWREEPNGFVATTEYVKNQCVYIVNQLIEYDNEEDNDIDRCYECRGYGDDYSADENGELICNCDTCTFNESNWEDGYWIGDD